jgi:hypothetical protein
MNQYNIYLFQRNTWIHYGVAINLKVAKKQKKFYELCNGKNTFKYEKVGKK